MKKLLLFAFTVFFGLNMVKSQIFTAKEGATSIQFYSKAPLEDIEATNKSASIVFKSTTGDLQMSISVQNFKFKNALMEEHFNENYLETEKYPKCVYKGKINETIDYSKDGEYKVTTTGKLELHGVTKDVTMSGVITVKGGEIKLSSKFQIKVADYNIKVPSMYVKNIAEVVDVTFNTTLEAFKKK